MYTRETATAAASGTTAAPQPLDSSATPAAKAAAEAECPDGNDVVIGWRLSLRAAGTGSRTGRGRRTVRLPRVLIAADARVSEATPRAAARRARGVRAAAMAAAVANHRTPWLAARLRRGSTWSAPGQCREATASNRRQSEASRRSRNGCGPGGRMVRSTSGVMERGYPEKVEPCPDRRRSDKRLPGTPAPAHNAPHGTPGSRAPRVLPPGREGVARRRVLPGRRRGGRRARRAQRRREDHLAAAPLGRAEAARRRCHHQRRARGHAAVRGLRTGRDDRAGPARLGSPASYPRGRPRRGRRRARRDDGRRRGRPLRSRRPCPTGPRSAATSPRPSGTCAPWRPSASRTRRLSGARSAPSPAASRSGSSSRRCCAEPMRSCSWTSPTTTSTCPASAGSRSGWRRPARPCCSSPTTGSCCPAPHSGSLAGAEPHRRRRLGARRWFRHLRRGPAGALRTFRGTAQALGREACAAQEARAQSAPGRERQP